MRIHTPTQRDIEVVLNKLSSHAKSLDLGAYISHTIDESGDCLVLLTNGKILLHYGELKDPDGLPVFRIPDIAARFCLSK